MVIPGKQVFIDCVQMIADIIYICRSTLSQHQINDNIINAKLMDIYQHQNNVNIPATNVHQGVCGDSTYNRHQIYVVI